jgi:threonine dehydratase
VIAGQGTIGMEILRQHPGPSTPCSVPLAAAAWRPAWPLTSSACAGDQGDRRAAVDSDAMKQSSPPAKRVELKDVGLFADGTAVKLVGEETFRLCRELLDEIMLVDTDAICAAIKDVFEDTRSILEPAGALAVAAPRRTSAKAEGPDLVAIACGANMNFDRLRFVAERAEVGERAKPSRRHHPGETGQLQAVLLGDRQPQHHRIQLPLCRPRHRPCLCRRADQRQADSERIIAN